MAIINCPECGEKISDTAKRCVHCGVSITVCPECNNIYMNDPVVCPSCGYEFVSVSKSAKHIEGEEISSAGEVMKKWQVSEPFYTYLFKPWIWILFISAAVVLLGIAVILLLTWDNILTMSSTMKNVKTLIVFAAIFYALFAAYSPLGEHLKYILLAKWCGRKGVKYENVISNSLKMDFDAMSVEAASEELGGLQWTISAASYAKNPIQRAKRQNTAIFMTICGIVEALFLGLFLSKNAEIFMAARVVESDILGIKGFEFSMIKDWWMLIVFAIGVLAYKISDMYFDKIAERERANWTRKNLPDLMPKFSRYVESENMVEYIMKRSGVDI